jgi:hypothetical protein
MRTCLFPINVKGGLLWFENLARADPTYILPTISVFSIIAIVYVNIFFGWLTFKKLNLFEERNILKSGIETGIELVTGFKLVTGLCI